MSTDPSSSKMIGSQPLVSVIMNCYNGAKFLREAIDSIVAQTYRDWELIFWDNQSTDGSKDILMSYNDARLKYFYAPTHAVLYEARNYAIEQATGEFIAFLDVDDWWEPEKLKEQIPLFNDEEVGLAYGNYWFVNERKKKTRRVAHNGVLPGGRVLNGLMGNYRVGLLTLVIRRRALERLDKIFDSRFQIIGDFDIVIRLAAEWKLACVQVPVASYRWHGNNISLLDEGRRIGELEVWCDEMQHQPIISSQPNLTGILDNVVYSKVIRALMQNDRSKAFSLFLSYPMNLGKMKLFAAILLPLWIIKTLRT